MKHCYGHPETRRLLEEWAGDQRLIMADFFFWHLGTPEQNTFEGLSRGLLQDLTRKDITTYVDDTIGTHPYFQELRASDPGGVEQILQDLVWKASGVFLWVVLACRFLLEGFAAFDYLDELRCRLDELPPDLESLFIHMLGRIEPRYQCQAAKLLRTCYQWKMHT